MKNELPRPKGRAIPSGKFFCGFIPATRPQGILPQNKTLFRLFFLVVIGLLIAGSIQAVCPVCTVAVSAGLGICRWLGVDDMISGVWIGGLIISSSIWTLSWLKRKQRNFKLSWLIIPALFYISVLLPLWKLNVVGHPFNRFYGVDKLIFGITSGSIAFLVGVWFDSFLRKRNNGNQLFKFQKVVVPVLLLTIFSLIFYLICKIRP